eukprot:4228268-Pleurochrysis_carterae.AAC.9
MSGAGGLLYIDIRSQCGNASGREGWGFIVAMILLSGIATAHQHPLAVAPARDVAFMTKWCDAGRGV